MTTFSRWMTLLALLLAGLSLIYAQEESPSLGDVARQTRQKKQTKDTAPSDDKETKNPKVITNEDLPKNAPISQSSSSEDSNLDISSVESSWHRNR